jgi:hypothetical protein
MFPVQVSALAFHFLPARIAKRAAVTRSLPSIKYQSHTSLSLSFSHTRSCRKMVNTRSTPLEETTEGKSLMLLLCAGAQIQGMPPPPPSSFLYYKKSSATMTKKYVHFSYHGIKTYPEGHKKDVYE